MMQHPVKATDRIPVAALAENPKVKVPNKTHTRTDQRLLFPVVRVSRIIVFAVALSLCAPHQSASTEANVGSTVSANAAASSEHFDAYIPAYPALSVYSILARLPGLGSDFLLLFWNPREFTHKWINSPDTRTSSVEVLSWSLALILFLYGLYAIVFRANPFDRFMAAATGKQSPKSQVPPAKSDPKIVGIRFKREYTSQSADGSFVEHSERVVLSPLPSFAFPEAKG
jgi:hypothetical protein